MSTDLTPNANILFASESIVDILGYVPEEVVGRSCFDYFHPDEVPFARNVHSRGVQLDKAAVLHYATIRARDGQWVACECVFTVVYQCLVACTSIYRRDAKNERKSNLSRYHGPTDEYSRTSRRGTSCSSPLFILAKRSSLPHVRALVLQV
jgi:PAS domain S-box-containing protein